MNESLAATQFIVERLIGASGAMLSADQIALGALIGRRVYPRVAPSKDPLTGKPPTYPLIIISVRSATDKLCVDGASAFVSLLVDIKSVGDGSYGALEPVEQLVYALCQKASGSVGDAFVMGCYREQQMMLGQTEDDRTYPSLVGTFRVRVCQTS